jgi:hypothetical protein
MQILILMIYIMFRSIFDKKKKRKIIIWADNPCK